eukprot:COSAG04_NODE_341_length_16294_cov_8.682618_2_plen_76_part_00
MCGAALLDSGRFALRAMSPRRRSRDLGGAHHCPGVRAPAERRPSQLATELVNRNVYDRPSGRTPAPACFALASNR